jgi:protocadherin Fat 1/2/3
VFDAIVQIYGATLLLPTHRDVIVARVTATDADQNATLRYAVDNTASVPSPAPFNIDAVNGVVTVSDVVLDSDARHSYDIAVTASDGKYIGRAVVRVVTDGLQSSALRFTQPEYAAEVPENSTEVRQLVLLQVAGRLLGEHVSFSLLNAGELFAVHPTSGAMRTTGAPFDRERRESYAVVAEARDGRSPPRVAHAVVRITIQDINDNAPVFLHQPYFALVPVEAEVGSVVRKVTVLVVVVSAYSISAPFHHSEYGKMGKSNGRWN